MMKANEIQIGDWVMVNDIEHSHPLQVAEIFKKCGAYYTTLYWDGMPDNVYSETLTADVDKVLPIPLTPEILLKNDFSLIEKTSKFYRWEYADGIYVNIDFKVDEPFVAIHNRSYYAVPYCYYVHQLQHALRLVGIDKQIIL